MTLPTEGTVFDRAVQAAKTSVTGHMRDEAARAIVRAVLAAIMEPDEGMSTTGKYAMKGSADLFERERAVLVYQAMLSSIIREGE